MKKIQKILISKDGPYLVSGNIPLSKEIAIIGKSGEPEKRKKGQKYTQRESYALCRCGKSQNKPFCDGSHIKNNFNGTETAKRKKYKEQADLLSGPELDLTDAQDLCSGARFCHAAGGIWNNVENSDDPTSKKIAIQTACNCPSGRLVVWDKTTWKPIEKKLEPSIGLIESHKKSAQILEKIFDEVGILICQNSKVTEYEIQQFIQSKFLENNHITDKDPPIVAFRENSGLVHYYPSKKTSKKLEKWTLILVDMRARSKFWHSPFADITQMFFYGKSIPKDIETIFNDVVTVRDKIIEFINKELKEKKVPTWAEIQLFTSEMVNKLWHKDKMNHYIWHCIWFYSPHWNRQNLSPTNNEPLKLNLWYTIEPWIYLKDKFWIRSEINFYIDEKLKLILTTKKQKSIRIINP